MSDCIFCQIANKAKPSNIVYEDEQVVAFMASMSINPGHILVVPKLHEPDFYKLPNDQYIALMEVVKNLAATLHKVYEPRKVGELIAGWDIPHVHVHVLPMYDYNDITSKGMLDNTIVKADQNDLQTEAAKITRLL